MFALHYNSFEQPVCMKSGKESNKTQLRLDVYNKNERKTVFTHGSTYFYSYIVELLTLKFWIMVHLAYQIKLH